jgi:tetratricopeptide (TPR) repeat protein
LLNFSAAIDDYSNSIRIDPKFAPGYVGRGNVHQMVGNKEAALGAYRKSIQISPNYAVAYAQLGNLYYRSLNNREAAIKEYEKAVQIFLRNGEVQPYNESIRILKSLIQHKIHVVQSGESLSKIAKNYDVLMQDIISSNRVTFPSLVTNPDNIDTGWKLKIPQ